MKYNLGSSPHGADVWVTRGAQTDEFPLHSVLLVREGQRYSSEAIDVPLFIQRRSEGRIDTGSDGETDVTEAERLGASVSGAGDILTGAKKKEEGEDAELADVVLG